MGEVALLLVCVAGSMLLSILCLVSWQIYIKLRPEYVDNIVYRVALAAFSHFGPNATHAIRADWAVVELRKLLPELDREVLLLYVKSSLSTMQPTGKEDDDAEIEAMFNEE